MLWELDYKEKEFSVQAAIAKNRPIPQWALDEPVGFLGDDFFMMAFYQLCSCRQLLDNGGVGPIPWNIATMYADRQGLEPDVSLAFEFIIREMDDAYLKRYAKKQKDLIPKKGRKKR